ncbi:MAG: putative inorganic carbon transporter subunit DabA [Campylobacterales bacterium]
MSVAQKLDSIKDTFPHYWPIGSFIHHNPLKGFEDLHFKEGLKRAQQIFGGRTYMDSSYFMELYNQGKIDEKILEENINNNLSDLGFDIPIEIIKKFMMEVSPQWDDLRRRFLYKQEEADTELYSHLEKNSIYNDKQRWLDSLTKNMTLYEINDVLFDTDERSKIQKNIIEFISRFLDEDQTTMTMPNRQRGMFEAFKLYENFTYEKDANSFVEEALNKLQVTDIKAYFITHLHKLHGWTGFIKYRSEDPDYFSQQQHPSSLIEYMAIRLYYELEAVRNRAICSFKIFEVYAQEKRSEVILKLLKDKNRLYGRCLDALENDEKTDNVLLQHITNELSLDAFQIQHCEEVLQSNLPLIDLASVIKKLRDEEGYIWLKSLEDTYIKRFVDDVTEFEPKEEEKSVASATFCLDVRSEVIRRNIENEGPYKTYGAGGFLGIPIAFVEFDKAHEQLLCPAVIKPKNVVFEIPKECVISFQSKKGINKTTKKVLSDLKNNPYTPFIMVEAIGWIFGINLFGKTFAPEKTEKLFKKLKPIKPKTTFTIDKLSETEIEFYVKKLHINIISEHLHNYLAHESIQKQCEEVWRHLVFGDELVLDIPEDALQKLTSEHHITPKDYEFQKNKLSLVGFTLEEKVHYLYNYLTMIGQVDNFPQFALILGHASISDNNPFESALDCGACGGSSSLPNARTLCMIANSASVREKIKEKGIDIPESTKFIPGVHTTTTDKIEFYDEDILTSDEMEMFKNIIVDFNRATQSSKQERVVSLPYTHTEKDLNIKTKDWSETRPEWGLAQNMGVFAGPRRATKHLAFNNRLFMHSYDWSIDNENADILTRIFNGPLVVGEWINLEHYFSTVDNHTYGAGSKVYHNIVSKVGVYSGNYSDLKIGLPTQTVLLEGKAYHEPVRLLTYMEAPLEIVGKAVENSVAKTFILNEWIRPIIIDKKAKKVYSYEDGDFKVIKELN